MIIFVANFNDNSHLKLKDAKINDVCLQITTRNIGKFEEKLFLCSCPKSLILTKHTTFPQKLIGRSDIQNIYLSIWLFLHRLIFHNILKEFESIKGIIRTRKSKKNKKHNGQKHKDKRTRNDLQNIHIKLKIE